MADHRIRKRDATIAIVFGIVTMAGLANAQPVTIDEFPLSVTSAGVAADMDGSVWFTSNTAAIVGHRSASGVITEYPYPGGPTPSTGGIVVGLDDHIWFGESSGEIEWNKIGRMSRTGGDYQEFEVPTSVHGSAFSHSPGNMIVGPDGNVWFTVSDALGRITPAGVITLFYLPPAGCPPPGFENYGAPGGLTVGPDGALWLALYSGYGLARFDMGTEQFEHFPVAACGTRNFPRAVVIGPDGNLWVTGDTSDKLYRVSLSGQVTTFALPGTPFGIVAIGGRMFVSRMTFNDIVQIDPSTGAVLETYLVQTADSYPAFMAVDAASNIWFTELHANNIGRLPNPLPCHHALTLSYDAGTLNLGFALGNRTAAYWSTWVASQDSVEPLWAVAIPPVSPAVFFKVPIPAFPSIGNVGVLTVLVTSDLNVCADWKIVDTGGVIAARRDLMPPIAP